MQDIIKQVRKLEINTKHLVDGLITGNYHSVFKGQGIEFSEIREYMVGDDVRSIDWKVTARYDKPFVKEFIEERDLRVYFVFDISGSGDFGSVHAKKQKAIELTASLMFAAMRNNDTVGLLLFSDRVEKFIPARKGRRHTLKVLSSLISHKAESKKTNIEHALLYFGHIVLKRSVIFVISDFMDKSYFDCMRILKRRHDVIALVMNDERETEIPDVGLIELEDEETGEQMLVDTSDEEFRESYRKLMNHHYEHQRKQFTKRKIDTIRIQSNEPYELPLKRFFRLRKHRVIR